MSSASGNLRPSRHVTLSFRAARRDDAAAIVQLVNSAYRGDISRLGWTTEADLLGGQRTDQDEVIGLVGQPGSVILLAERATELVGAVHLQRHREHGTLGLFAIRPGLQGVGIGSVVMDEAERSVQRWWGVDRMRLSVIGLRSELIAFYERRGYRRTGVREPFPSSVRFGIPRRPDLDFEVLEKPLARR